MDVGDLFGAGLNAASGGVLGAIGSALGAGAKIWQAKLEMQERAAQRAHDLEVLKLTNDEKAREGARESELARVKGSYDGLTASINAASAITGAHPVVADIIALIRPSLTIALVAISVWVFSKMLQGRLLDYVGAEDAAILIRDQVNAIVFLTSTAVVWWFGDRAQTPRR